MSDIFDRIAEKQKSSSESTGGTKDIFDRVAENKTGKDKSQPFVNPMFNSMADFGTGLISGAAKGLGKMAIGAERAGRFAPLTDRLFLESSKQLSAFEGDVKKKLEPHGLGENVGSALPEIGAYVAADTLAPEVGVPSTISRLGGPSKLAFNALKEGLKAGGISFLGSGGDEKATQRAAEIGAAFPVVTAVGKPLAGYLGTLLGKTTRAGQESILTAINSGWDKYFKTAMRDKNQMMSNVDDLLDSVKSIRNQRRLAYQERLSKIPMSSDLSSAKPKIEKKMSDLLNDYKIKVRVPKQQQPTGLLSPSGQPLTSAVAKPPKLNLSKSTALGSGDEANIVQVWNQVRNWKDYNAKGLDQLKQQLDNFYGNMSSERGKRFVEGIRSEVRNSLGQVKGYNEMTKSYEESTKFINDIEREFSAKRDANPGMIVRKLTNSLNKDNEYRKLMLEALDNAAGEHLKEKVAGSSFAPFINPGLIGLGVSLEAGRAIPGLAHSLTSPLALTGAATTALSTSPRAVGEILAAISAIRHYTPEAAKLGIRSGAKGALVKASEPGQPESQP